LVGIVKHKDVTVENLIHRIEALAYNLSNTEEYEKKILQAVLNEQEDAEIRNMSLSLAELHVIDCVERNEAMNTTAIAKKLMITKGGISKITTKLIQKNMIEARRLPNNQKETYFSLTTLGRKIFRIHDVLHQRAAGQFSACFANYSKEELRFADRFLGDLLAIFDATLTGKTGEN